MESDSHTVYGSHLNQPWNADLASLNMDRTKSLHHDLLERASFPSYKHSCNCIEPDLDSEQSSSDYESGNSSPDPDEPWFDGNEGLTFEEDECWKEGGEQCAERVYLDLAAGAQVYMEKQMIHVAAVVHGPMYLLCKLIWLIIRSPLYAPYVVKPTLRMPVLLFRRKWEISRLSSYLYIRCSATSLKAYGKIWLTPGNILNLPNYCCPTWLRTFLKVTLFSYHWRKLFKNTVVRPLKWSASFMTLSPIHVPPTAYLQNEKGDVNQSATRSKRFHDVNLRDPAEFPILLNYSIRFRLYRAFPSRLMSRLWGDFNKLTLPVWLRHWAFSLYIWMFSCDLDEANETDLCIYRNLREFFTRKLKPGARAIGESPLVSPADGTVLYCGKVENDTLEQIKGVRYTMQSFMGPLSSPVFSTSLKHAANHSAAGTLNSSSSDSRLLTMDKTAPHKTHPSLPLMRGVSELNDTPKQLNRPNVYMETLLRNPQHELQYCIIYLAPGDYHRFHSPADWTVQSRRHFSGELFSVKPRIARWLQGLFCLNERALYVGAWQHGFFSFTAVGATNVGSICVPFDEDLETSSKESGQLGFYEDKSFQNSTAEGVDVTKGEDIGHFNLGSTIVLVFEAPKGFQLSIRPGQKVKYGQSIGSM